MNETQFTNQLQELLDLAGYLELEDTAAAGLLGDSVTRHFADAGVLTVGLRFKGDRLVPADGEGLVVRTADGSEFQLTVRQSA